MEVTLSVATLNVRSIKTAMRAQQVMGFLETVKADIICLQECGLPFRSSYGEWERRWPHGPSMWSGSDNNRADGVAVLTHNSLVRVVGHTVVEPGRVLVVSLSFGGVAFRVVNVYAPALKQDRFQLLHGLSPHLLGRVPLLLVGDFNCVLGREGRRGFGSDFRLDKTSLFLNSILKDFTLVDLRESGDSGPVFTWFSPDGARASKIDFIFYRDFKGGTVSTSPVYFTDHLLLTGFLTLQGGLKVGGGLWKLNCLQLEDPRIVSGF